LGIFSRIKQWFRRRRESKKEEPISIYKREEPPVEQTTVIEKPKEKPIVPEKILEKKADLSVKPGKKPSTRKIISRKPKKEKIIVKAEKIAVEAPVIEKPISVTAEIDSEARSEAKFLKREYETLTNEKEQLKKDMIDLDKRYSSGDLTAMQRDQKFREKMVRAAYIAQRLYEIKSKTALLGIPIE
jgi:hypothetical protein